MEFITKVKFCNRCKKETMSKLVRNIISNGTSQVYWLCQTCNKSINTPTLYISHSIIEKSDIQIAELPVINNYSGSNLCAVCNSPFAEWHHFAPRFLFPDADAWPGAYLCPNHHKKWHDLVTPNMSRWKNERPIQNRGIEIHTQ